jgi:hypothetical protein
MPLKTQIFAGISAAMVGAPDVGKSNFEIDGSAAAILLGDGSGTGKANAIYQDRITLAASANQDIDLRGTLVGALGEPVVFASVKAIFIRAAAANINDVIVGGGTNPFLGPLGGTTPTHTLKPGGLLLWANPNNGWTVQASTSDILRVANGGAGSSVTLELVVVGVST